MNTSITVVAICGSLRTVSTTRMALRIALAGAQEVGAQTRLLDLRDYHLPYCRGAEGEPAYPDDVHRLRAEVAAAQGILLGTPEYHGSYSGVLKNALDLMGFDEFEGKMVGLVGVAGGAMGATNALNHLRVVGRSLHAWVIPEQVSIPSAARQFDTAGNLKNPQLAARLTELGRQVARFAFLHTSDRAAQFVRAWEEALDNPGGRHPADDES